MMDNGEGSREAEPERGTRVMKDVCGGKQVWVTNIFIVCVFFI
jgi:hypothetical protein